MVWAIVLRVKDPKKSLEYYKLLGLSEIEKKSFPDNKFDLYFLGQLLPRIFCLILTTNYSLRWTRVCSDRATLLRP